jgi:hypothetical protein
MYHNNRHNYTQSYTIYTLIYTIYTLTTPIIMIHMTREKYKTTIVDGDRFVCPFPACGKSFHSLDAAFNHIPIHEQVNTHTHKYTRIHTHTHTYTHIHTHTHTYTRIHTHTHPHTHTRAAPAPGCRHAPTRLASVILLAQNGKMGVYVYI